MSLSRLFSIVVLSLGLAACGSSGGGGSGTGRDSLGQCHGNPGQTCTGTDTYETCVENACDAQFKAALGADYKNGNFSGVCASYFNCIIACNCGDNTCQGACTAQLSGDCQTAAIALGSCTSGSTCTPPVCTGGSVSVDAAVSASGACATLATCCPKLPSNTQSGCQQIVATNMDNACQQALNSFGSMCN
jgi:hypothetical protein